MSDEQNRLIDGYRAEVNELRKVVGVAMAWRSMRKMQGLAPTDAAERALAAAVDAFVPLWEQM